MREMGEANVGASDEFIQGLEDSINARADVKLDAMEVRVNDDVDAFLAALDVTVNTSATAILADAVEAKTDAEAAATQAAADRVHTGSDRAAALASASAAASSASTASTASTNANIKAGQAATSASQAAASVATAVSSSTTAALAAVAPQVAIATTKAGEASASADAAAATLAAAPTKVQLAASTGAALVGTTAETVQAALDARTKSADLGANDGFTLVKGTWFDGTIGLVSALATSIGAALIGWKASSTATPRSIEAKLREGAISLKDFGAKGDGTTDDTAAIQLAVMFVANYGSGGSSAGRSLFAGDGEYGVTGTVVLPENKPIHFFGCMGGARFKRLSGVGAIFEVRSSSTLEKLFFVGSDFSNIGVYLNGANTAKLSDCYFQNQRSGVVMYASYAVEFESCIFDANYLYGFVATTSAHNTVFTRCNFFANGLQTGTGHAVNFTVPSDVVVFDACNFEHNNVHIVLNGCTAVRLTGSYLEYHRIACFDFPAMCYGVTIENNWLALGDVTSGGANQILRNVTGGSFTGNTLYKQAFNFDNATLVAFDVGVNRLLEGGTLGAIPWIPLPLTNGWAQQANYTPHGYIKDQKNRVYLRGALVSGTAPSVIFTLPVGYRPSAITVFSTSSANGACRITINPNGDVVATVAASNNASLDGIMLQLG